MKQIHLFFVALLAFAFCSPAIAGNYHVEVLVFKNTAANSNGSASYSEPLTPPSSGKTWRLSNAYLNNYAKKLSASSSYTVLQHTAWGQKSAPYNRSAAQTLGGSSVQGWVKVYATSLLFAQLDITVNGQRLAERRRLKLNEVHFFDNAGFGVLMRVSRS